MSVGFRDWRAVGDAAALGGKVHTAHFRKVPSQASTAGHWVDLTMAAGNPQPNYYASTPLEAAVLDGFRGIFHGDDKAPSSMHLASLELCTVTAGLVGAYYLLDYLLYYPFVDLDAAGEEQTMIAATTLPRYSDGAGVRAMLVAVAPTTGGGSFTYTYVNQDGVTKVSPTIKLNTTAANIATIITSQQGVASPIGLYLPLNSGDTGIRSVESFSVVAPGGGLGALVLVRPLAAHAIREINVPAEVDYFTMMPSMPRIYDGAYLGLIMNCAATVAAGQLAGRATFFWS